MLHDVSVKSIRIKEEKSALEEYLVSVGKLSVGEEHPMGITTLDVGGRYSVFCDCNGWARRHFVL